ncbi:MAG: amino acid permease [Lachnospiraceae bacterium]|nr:amino acid permease [Lachnospiraceae bacterium]
MDSNPENKLRPYLSPFAVWALSFGCAVGWGAFVMPGNTFLPAAGPLGSVIGIVLGGLLMIILGVNYAYMMKRYPNAGGAFTYTNKTFGYDHGFLNAWFLILTYIAIVWANVTALALIVRNVFGKTLQFGFHYKLFDYDIYFGEILFEVLVLVLCGLACIHLKKGSAVLQLICAVILIVGIIVCACMVFNKDGFEPERLLPSFRSEGNKVIQVLNIMLLAPWAFIGFESVSHSAEEFKFPVKKVFGIMTAAIITGIVAYCLPILMAAYVRPEGFDSWETYISGLGSLSGRQSMPVFNAIYESVGAMGVKLLGIVVLCGIITGIVGNMIAISRILYVLSADGTLPAGFDKLNKNGSPARAFTVIIIVSAIIPFFGRTPTGWIVDVTTVGATIAYGYTSAAALKQAVKEKNARIRVTGIVGVVVSVLFCIVLLIPNIWIVSTLAAESYLILAVWSILGFLVFRYVFRHDTGQRFGKSTIAWIAMLFLIFFTSLIWMRQAMHRSTEKLANEISTYYTNEMTEAGVAREDMDVEEEKAYLEDQMVSSSNALLTNSLVQFVIILIALFVLFSMYAAIMKRERKLEIEKTKAEENSRAKSTFLSNMSHDIRTPMNAIIGYTNLAKRDDIGLDEVKDYLDKIDGSSRHLLALINDVLEMSRIESGKMELDLVDTDLRKVMGGLKDMFVNQMSAKKIDFNVYYSEIEHYLVKCDSNSLNRVLLNLVSNAMKFTPEGGNVTVCLKELSASGGNTGQYYLSVKDSGIGMTEEFAEKVFEAFERERTSTVSGIQGTGLGMAITKSIVELMGGDISVDTAPGKGTSFIVHLPLEIIDKPVSDSAEGEEGRKTEGEGFAGMRLLLVEDIEMNREIAEVLLEELGFEIESAENGQEALDKVKASKPGYFDGILMDIQMPVMDGYEATEKIRSLEDDRLKSIPIIAMTANAFSEDVKKATDAGMNAHVAKPIDMDVLEETLKKVLKKQVSF